MEKINLLDKEIPELEQILENMGEQKYRAKQIFRWFGKGVTEIDEMTDLSKSLREKLKQISYIGSPTCIRKLASKTDGTVKYLFELNDGNTIESVLMKYKYGYSVCISSQVGCKMGCKFCASTQAGFVRNLTAGEMLGQVLYIGKDIGERIGNIVVMGIGEPFDNYDNLMKFFRLVHHPDGLNMGYRHITVSTCGLVPGIERFTGENIPVNLSVSLHAPNDSIRKSIMPVANKYSIDKLISVCKIYTEETKRRVTFEYALISGVNDSKENAEELASRLRGMLCHVNLIPVNTVEGTGLEQSSRKSTEEFKAILERSGIQTTVRRELGADINAACGQLRISEMNSRRC